MNTTNQTKQGKTDAGADPVISADKTLAHAIEACQRAHYGSFDVGYLSGVLCIIRDYHILSEEQISEICRAHEKRRYRVISEIDNMQFAEEIDDEVEQ